MNETESELSPEVNAACAAIIVGAQAAVRQATEQMFCGLSSLAPYRAQDELLAGAIEHAYDAWSAGVAIGFRVLADVPGVDEPDDTEGKT